MWPFGPVRTVPTDPAMPELTVSVPATDELVGVEGVVADPAGAAVEEVVVEPEADVPELHAAAVTARAARRATSAQCLLCSDLGSDLCSDLDVELGMSVSELGWSFD